MRPYQLYIPKQHISLYPTTNDQAEINRMKRGSRRTRSMSVSSWPVRRAS